MPIGYQESPRGLWDRGVRRFLEWGSKSTPNTDDVLLETAQDGFRHAQNIAYACVTHVGQQLRVGMTEKEAAQLLADYLKAAGSDRFIHRPFAWFGDHTRFDGYAGYADYHPSERRLGVNDIAILDVSPVINGYTADVGYTLGFGPNPELESAKSFLLTLRDAIPVMFSSSRTPKEIWADVDQMIADAGFDNIHARYPFCVLGHRVFHVKERAAKARRLPFGAMGWFSLETNLAFLKTGASAGLTPHNVGSKIGLWAIEPHIGWAGGGAKFEEILVVDQAGARWLSDDVPHVKAHTASSVSLAARQDVS